MTTAIRIRQTLLGDRAPVATLVILSLLFEVAWFSIQNIGFHCDSPAYIQFTWGLFGYSISRLVLWVRTIGYPLLIALGGVVGPNATFHSFLGILLIQAAMAVAMPVLIFKTLEPYYRRLAFFIALATIVSLQPYITSKLVMTEQSFKFFIVLLVYLAVKTYQSQSPRWWLAALSATCIILTLMRPAALLMAIIVFGALVVRRREYWKQFAAGFLALCATMFTYSFIVCLYLPPAGLYLPETYSRLTELAFYDLYMHDNASGLNARRGSRRKEMREIVEAFARDLKAGWTGRIPAQYFAPYANDPKGWVDSLYTDVNRFKYMALRDAVLIYRDQGSDSKLKANAQRAIPRAIREAFFYEPWRLIEMIFRYGLAMPGGGSGEIMFNKLFSEYRAAAFSPDNGPASREFIDAVRVYYNTNPTMIKRLILPPNYKDYTNDTDGFIREQLIGVPNANIFYYIWDVLVEMKGAKAAHELYDAVVREGIAHAPLGSWSVYKRLFDSGTVQLHTFFFDPYSNFDFFYNLVFCYQNTQDKNPTYERELLTGMRLLSWFDVKPDYLGAQSWFDYLVKDLWMFTHLACNIFILIGAPFAIWSRSRWPILVIAALILSQAIPGCYLIWAQDRYVDQILPITILLAGFVAAGIIDLWRKWVTPSLTIADSGEFPITRT